MEAGRELDALIAQKLMGLSIRQATPIGLQYPVDWSAKGDIFYSTDYGMAPVPHYSTDIADAWLVVEKMREIGYSCFIYDYHKIENMRNTGDWQVGFVNYEGSPTSDAHTVPHAICRAALKAIDDHNQH